MSPSEPSTPGRPGRRRKTSEPDEAQTETTPSEAAPTRAGGRRKGGGRRKKEPKRFGRMLPVLVGALVVALIALGAVLYVQLSGDGAGDEAAQESRPAVYRVVDTGNMNEVLASRDIDSRELNAGELFERSTAEISSQSIDFALRDSELVEDCSEAVWGDEVEEALAAADCTQAGSATYMADNYFGAATVFNLDDVEDSRAVASAMDLPEPEEEGEEPIDPGFILPPSGEDPLDRLGSGYSAADAIVSGHYLVVVWVQATDSDSVEDRVSLASPLVALANFRDPLYRRMVELSGTEDTGGEEETVEPPVEEEPLEEEPVEEAPADEEPVVPAD